MGTDAHAQKLTATVPQPHHRLEDILGNPYIQRLLGPVTARGKDGMSLFERVCANYDNPNLSFAGRLKWWLPTKLIDLALARAGLNKDALREKLFHHRPTVKALNLAARSIWRYGLSRPQRFAAPLFVVWNLTEACNLRCKHCYQNARPRPAPDELTLAEKLNAVDQLAEMGGVFLALAGGEPLVSPHIWRLCEHAAERGIHLSLATNGTLLTPDNVRRLIACGVRYVEVSIDRLDPGEHDAFRGVPGAWRRSIQGIRNSVAGGMRTGLATCFTRDNVDTVDDMIAMAIDLGCSTFSHFNFIPVGRGRAMMDSDLTPGQRELLVARLNRHLQRNRINIISTAPQFGRSCILYGAEGGLIATGHAGRGATPQTAVLARYVGGCGAGRCYCSIQPNGIVTPCVYIPSVHVGDLRRRPLAEIWECALFEMLSDRSRRGGHCGVCDYGAYCGGCRARALSYTGDINAGDPGCSLNYGEWDRLAAQDGLIQLRMEGARR